MQMCVKDGLRQTTAGAFLGPIMDDPNLTVLTNARALRLVFEGDRCVGVEISRDGRIELVQAGAEVVVSCGSPNCAFTVSAECGSPTRQSCPPLRRATPPDPR